MRRYALMILVIALLLINTLLKNAAESNPLTDPQLWELRFALPGGVVAAASLFVALGLGAQFWRGLLPLCGGAEWTPRAFWTRLMAVGLWCGWLPLLCAQTYTAGETQLALGAPSHWLLGAFAALLICRAADGLLHWRWWGLFSALVAAAAAVLCGQELFPIVPLCPLVLGLMAAVALRVLTGRTSAPQLVWLLVACFTFCAYVSAFGYLLAWYVPSPALPGTTTWGLWMGGVFLVGGLALIMLEPLRSSAAGPRLIALAGLLAGAAWVWPELAPAQRVLPAQQAVGIGTYAAALVILSLPAALLMLDRRRGIHQPQTHDS